MSVLCEWRIETTRFKKMLVAMQIVGLDTAAMVE